MEFIDLKAQQARIADKIRGRIEAVLSHGRYILGPEVNELEEALQEYTGAGHAIGVSSGTDALLLALMALDIGPGDEVITTPFSFFATAEVIALVGATPVFCDIDPVTYNIDPGKIEAAITQKTRALIPVGLYGQCADMDPINQIADRHQLPVIEDAAQSFGATYNTKRSGALSTIGVTSFFPAKPLGCYGDGGACFTSDEKLATRIRELSVHGQDRRYHHPRIGINGRLDTLQAAILLEKLAIFDDEIEKRNKIAARYNGAFGALVATPALAVGRTHVWAQYTIEVERRDTVAESIKNEGVPVAIHYPIPLHRQTAFASLGYKEGDFPVTEASAGRVLSLPMGPYLTEADQDKVVAVVKKSVVS